jgi:predicted nucleotidyltransferase
MYSMLSLITLSPEQLIRAVTKVLTQDDNLIFAYLYGSMVSEGKGNDVDIAVFFDKNQADSYSLAVDQKIDLHKETGMPPDVFDVSILNKMIFINSLRRSKLTFLK